MGVEVRGRRQALASAVLLVPFGCPGPDERTAVAREGVLYLAQGSEVVALGVPLLELLWRTESAMACVFGLHEIPGDDALIAHGEITVARVRPDGGIAWEQGGAEIFTGELRIDGDAVEVTDWNGDLYRFRLSDGEILVGPPPARLPPRAGKQPETAWWMRVRGVLRRG